MLGSRAVDRGGGRDNFFGVAETIIRNQYATINNLSVTFINLRQNVVNKAYTCNHLVQELTKM
jgi:hypothetical protein